jgi:polysaccharide export outer membrane protein
MLLLGSTTLAACAGMDFPTTERGQANLVVRGINLLRVTPQNVGALGNTNGETVTAVPSNPPRDPSIYVYPVGSGDQLRVQTWTTPERRSASEGQTISEGPIVNEDGQFFYPYVGMMNARGRSVAEIRADLEQELRVYLNNPQVEVDVERFNAHRVTLVGEVASPGSTVLTNVPLRLLDLINQAGPTGLSDLRRVEVRRHGREYSVNLRAYMEYGASGQNPIMLPGDMVFVPAMNDKKVFVFGAIGNGEIALGDAGKSLTEVLAEMGGISQRANASGIFVFRRPPGQNDGFNVFQFDLSDASYLMMTAQFSMAPLDVVFVTTDPIARWNDSVGRLLSPVTGIRQARSIAEDFAQ